MLTRYCVAALDEWCTHATMTETHHNDHNTQHNDQNTHNNDQNTPKCHNNYVSHRWHVSMSTVSHTYTAADSPHHMARLRAPNPIIFRLLCRRLDIPPLCSIPRHVPVYTKSFTRVLVKLTHKVQSPSLTHSSNASSPSHSIPPSTTIARG